MEGKACCLYSPTDYQVHLFSHRGYESQNNKSPTRCPISRTARNAVTMYGRPKIETRLVSAKAMAPIESFSLYI